MGAIRSQGAAFAPRRARRADRASMPDQTVGQEGPRGLRGQALEGELDLDRVGLVRQAEAADEADDVGVHRDRGTPEPDLPKRGLVTDSRIHV